MNSEGYRDGVAMWAAVGQKAKAKAKETGQSSTEIIRQFVFARFLARVFCGADSSWVLKGGAAVLARVKDARTTKDIDLLRVADSLDIAVADLRVKAKIDLGDHFRFEVAKIEPNSGGTGQPGIDGIRVRMAVFVGAMEKTGFGVDLVTGSLMTAQPDQKSAPVLEIKGTRSPTLLLYPVVDHVADKLCAIQARYGTNGLEESSRERDLVDLVVFARTQDLDGMELRAAVHAEWNHRKLPGNPIFSPPESWNQRYPKLARKVPACNGLENFDAAEEFVSGFLTPAIKGECNGRFWSAQSGAWQPK